MQNYYSSELEGMQDFYKDINVEPDYSFNTDGRVNGPTKTKTGEFVKVPKYPTLDRYISELKEELKKYYSNNIEKKLFEYELLK